MIESGLTSDSRMRARLLTVLSCIVVVGLVGCRSMPEPPPPAPVGVAVTPLEEGRLVGGRAVFLVEAPLDHVVDMILDFPSQADYRPMVIDAQVLSTTETGGEVIIQFKGGGGVDPRATCRYTVERDEDEGRVDLAYEMIDRSMALWALKGGFVFRARPDGTTHVSQVILLSAILLDRQRILRDLADDARAIQARAIETLEKSTGED